MVVVETIKTTKKRQNCTVVVIEAEPEKNQTFPLWQSLSLAGLIMGVHTART